MKKRRRIMLDDVYTHITYAAISDNADILDKPDVQTVAADPALTVILQETDWDYFATTGNLQTEKRRICSGPPPKYVSRSFLYDQYGNVKQVTDEAGIVTTIEPSAAEPQPKTKPRMDTN